MYNCRYALINPIIPPSASRPSSSTSLDIRRAHKSSHAGSRICLGSNSVEVIGVRTGGLSGALVLSMSSVDLSSAIRQSSSDFSSVIRGVPLVNTGVSSSTGLVIYPNETNLERETP